LSVVWCAAEKGGAELEEVILSCVDTVCPAMDIIGAIRTTVAEATPGEEEHTGELPSGQHGGEEGADEEQLMPPFDMPCAMTYLT
jgi:hypothetical protein